VFGAADPSRPRSRSMRPCREWKRVQKNALTAVSRIQVRSSLILR
jgi:hypothetical protein